MSLEDAKKAIEALKTDKAMLEKLSSAQTKEEKLEIASKAGFNFTLEEFKEAREMVSFADTSGEVAESCLKRW